MNYEIEQLLDIVEEIKDKLNDNDYKRLIEQVQKVHSSVSTKNIDHICKFTFVASDGTTNTINQTFKRGSKFSNYMFQNTGLVVINNINDLTELDYNGIFDIYGHYYDHIENFVYNQPDSFSSITIKTIQD